MSIHLLDAMAREGFEQVVAIHDRRSGLRAFLAIHNTVQGPAFGGVRRWAYRDERESLMDCLRLSRAMTHKCALAGLNAGGAKIVIHEMGGEDWEGAYRHLGDRVEALGGQFYTGPDVGTGEQELRWMFEQTSFVTDPGEKGPGQLAECTAEGVFQGMAAALRHLHGEEDWPARRVVVQGLGAVGGCLAARLVGQGATVIGSDLDDDLAARRADELGIQRTEVASALELECDVFAPCAMGGLVHDLTLERLNCRVVAGAANNVLARPLHGDVLHGRGILLVPDFALNAGALIRGALFHLEGRRESVEEIGQRVGAAVTEILDRAKQDDAPPTRVAVRIAEERIASWNESVTPVQT